MSNTTFWTTLVICSLSYTSLTSQIFCITLLSKLTVAKSPFAS